MCNSTDTMVKLLGYRYFQKKTVEQDVSKIYLQLLGNVFRSIFLRVHFKQCVYRTFKAELQPQQNFLVNWLAFVLAKEKESSTCNSKVTYFALPKDVAVHNRRPIAVDKTFICSNMTRFPQPTSCAVRKVKHYI